MVLILDFICFSYGQPWSGPPWCMAPHSVPGSTLWCRSAQWSGGRWTGCPSLAQFLLAIHWDWDSQQILPGGWHSVGCLCFILESFHLLCLEGRGSHYIAEECRRTKEHTAIAKTEVYLNNRSATTLFGLLSLGLLGICIILEMGGTGLVWWSSQQLGSLYQVVGDCFCFKVSGQTTSTKKNVYNVECPVVEDLVCESVYNTVSTVTKHMFTMTRECQRLDGIQQDPTCLEWHLFKVLRILMPVLALIKLPVLLLNCNRWLCWLCKEEKQNYQASQGKFSADFVSWIGQDVLLSPLLQFYSNMCTPLENQTLLGERLGPVGQEADKDLPHLPPKAAALSSSNYIPKTASPCRYNPPLTAVHCPVPPFLTDHEASCSSKTSITKDDSPPDIEDHTISTPIHPRLRTPSFDLSKVVKPAYHNTSIETNVPTSRLNLKPQAALPSSIVFSFRSAPPPLPLPDMSKLCSDGLHLPPPFFRSKHTLPWSLQTFHVY